MKTLSCLGIALVTAILSATASAVPDRIGDFALLDSDGEFHQLSRYRHKEALVLMSFDNACSSIGSALVQLQTLQTNWEEQGIAFALINSSPESEIEALRAVKADLSLQRQALWVEHDHLACLGKTQCFRNQLTIVYEQRELQTVIGFDGAQRFDLRLRGGIDQGEGDTLFFPGALQCLQLHQRRTYR